MIRKFKFIFFIILMILPVRVLGEEFELYSNNVLVYNLNDNEILYMKNEKDTVSIASLTKIMTVIVSLENINDLDETVTFPNIDSLRGYSKLGYKSGEKVTYRDLLYSAILPSAADSTEGLAILISGSTNKFISLMNEKANELEMSNTHFTSTYGKDSTDNYSTMEDLLKLMIYALNNYDFYKIFTSMNYTLTNGKVINNSISYYNRNTKLDITSIIGDKTGFTDIAGYCMISIYRKGDSHLLIITTNANPKLGKPTHLIDNLNIGDYYFNNYEYVDLLKKGDTIGYIKIFGVKESIYSNETIMAYLPKDIEVKTQYNELSKINFSSKIGGKVGEYIITYGEKEIKKDVNIPNTSKIKFLLYLLKYLEFVKWLIIIFLFA